MFDRKTFQARRAHRDRATEARRSDHSRSDHSRPGVILLVVMVLLALMALLGLTLVLVTAQGRLSALAAARSSLQDEHDNQELASVIQQVVSGSTDTNSSFGAHGLLEDLYGLPQFFGRIVPGSVVLPIGETAAGALLLEAGNNGTGANNGTFLLMTITAGQASGSAGLGPQTATQFVLPQNSGAFCGQVVTMLTGNAAGQSARVVGYYFMPGSQVNVPPGTALLQVSSFGGIVPQPGDEFLINGRAFAGTGFGLDLTQFYSGAVGVWAPPQSAAAATFPLLTALENPLNVIGPPANVQASATGFASWGMPYAYLPNHARISLTAWSPSVLTGTYWDAAGPGGANEPYDAPDFQNLMLAMHYWSPFLLPTDPASGTLGHVVTPIPSLHRPELVAWYYNQSIINPAAFNGRPAMDNPTMRRKVILRPEPTDNQFQDLPAPYGNLKGPNGIWDAREPYHDINGNGYYDVADVYGDLTPAFLDLNGDGVWTAGEPDYSGNTFNPVTGCWFIAANGGWALDTQNPPGYTPPSGMSGTASGLDFDNDGDGVPDSIWVDAGLPVHTESDGTLTKHLAAILCIDLDGKVNLNAHGTLAQLDLSRYTTPPSGPFGGGAATLPLYSDALLFQRSAPVGQGYGPADVNPLHLFVRSHSLVPTGGKVVGATSALTYYQTLLQGFNYQNFLANYNGYLGSGANPPVLHADGRYGEGTRLTVPPGTQPGFNFPGVYPAGSYYPFVVGTGIFNGPRAGWSQWFDPYSTSLLVGAGYSAFWVNDPVALVRFSDIRPGLLTPPSNATPFFFDFLAGTATHVPTGHGTPSDLHSRGILTTDLTGRPYYAGTLTAPWQTLPAAWASTMVDLAVTQYASAGEGFLAPETVFDEGVDTQYEMSQAQNARQAGENTGNSISGIPDFSTVDARFTATELESMLRSHEWGSGSSADPSQLQVQRLTGLETAWNYLATGTKVNMTTTRLGNDNARLAVTTESSDLPNPNVALTPRQMQDVVQYVNFMQAGTFSTSLGNGLGLTLNNASLVELARARILADNFSPVLPGLTGPGFLTGGANPTPSMADLSLFGNLKNNLPNVLVYPTLNAAAIPMNPAYPIYPLLAPDLVMGMRLDVNRLLGNGFDDNQNGVVDEPNEVLWVDKTGTWHTESLLYPFSRLNPGTTAPVGQLNNGAGVLVPTNQNNTLALMDLNNDGFYPGNPITGTFLDPQTGTPLPLDPTTSDMRARQLLAKHLYCLAMLLVDDRPYYVGVMPPLVPNPVQNVVAQIFNTLGAPMPPGWPNYAALAGAGGSREQAAYVIAQWAINVVDFRDRDSIMTPFEFDLYPFRADDVTLPNVTWNVDDIVDPALPGVPVAWSRQDDSQPWRGIVWGCERPELLMTETVAFHDRGSADTAAAQNVDDQQQTPPTGNDTLTTNTGAMPYDKDFDQVRRPRGSTIVELFNPTNYWDAPQFDLQTSTAAWVGGLPQPWQTLDGNGNQGYGIDLAQVAFGQPFGYAGTGPVASPVWRIVIAYAPKGWQTAGGGGDVESLCYNNAAPTGTPPLTGGSGWTSSPQGGGVKVLDPRVPVLPPNAIHRAVYFTPFQQSFITGATPIAPSTLADTLLNNSFFADPDIFGPVFNPVTGLNSVPKQPSLLLPPGQYALVGPANRDVTGATGNYYVYGGASNLTSTSTTNVNTYNWNLQLANLTLYNTIAYQYGAAMAPQGPYALGYVPAGTTLNAAGTTSIKPVIGVPIQTNWYQSVGGQPVYAIHNSAGFAGSTAANPSPVGVLTTCRMSVSEPEHGYPVWQNGGIPATGVIPAANMAALQDDATYYLTPGTSAPGFGQFPQHPFDSGQGQPAGSGPTYAPYLQFGDIPNPCVAAVTGATESTNFGYTVLYLQRLANPLQAWDGKMNPYITVDSMPVDLTSYTGEPSATGGATRTAEQSTYYTLTGGVNPTSQSSSWAAVSGTAGKFDTRRRGYDPATNGASTVLIDQQIPNIWVPMYPAGGYIVSTNPYSGGSTWGAQNNTGTSQNPMPLTGYSTLGYVNREYTGSIYPGGVYSANAAPVGASGMPAYMYNGDPIKAFPWYAWNNRPYVSQYELMLVPASSPSSQGEDFGMLGWAASGGSGMNEYQPYVLGTPPVTPVAGMLPAAQFMQLLNFFNNQQTVSGGAAKDLLPNLYRVFEFLQVSSRYTGTQDLLNPSQFSGDVGAVVTAASSGGTVLSASHLFHTPFNWLSRYRDPGRINLNTIFDPVVFQSLMDDYPGTVYANATDLNPITTLPDAMLFPRGLWATVAQSRQGFYLDPVRTYLYGGLPMAGPYTVNATGAVLNPSAPPNPVSQFAFNPTGAAGVPGINSDVPTYFANPFRPDGSAAFVPPANVNPTVNTVYPWLSYNKLMHQWNYPGGVNNSVNATLLRSQDSVALGSFPMPVNRLVTPPVAAASVPGPLAMFDDTAFDTTNLNATYKSGSSPAYRNAGQNATFQYQMFNRMGNTTTNRSNVYAIWVALGKFEVQQVGVSPINPDGYKLIAPAMDATGSKQAVTRGFYIFDRSIPMGFQRGQDLNIEKGFLLERVLQEEN